MFFKKGEENIFRAINRLLISSNLFVVLNRNIMMSNVANYPIKTRGAIRPKVKFSLLGAIRR
ncbi:MAG: hypothetical protein KAU07_00345 [Candidatus Andersenbacteria bacterium]|nr:hypothetical protein [Candidatus Andersenbacteria bacterium]